MIAADVPLLHTRQLLPDGDIGSMNSKQAVGSMFGNLNRFFGLGNAIQQVAKLNVAVSREEIAEEVSTALLGHFPDNARPVLSLVVSPQLTRFAQVTLMRSLSPNPIASKRASSGWTAIVHACWKSDLCFGTGRPLHARL